jgi:type I restriction enzyme, R subunit
MSFNEMNTIENALRDHLSGRQKDEGGKMNEVREDSALYGSSFIPHNSSFPKRNYVHVDNLALYGKQPQDVLSILL